jgi:hypothetical protein
MSIDVARLPGFEATASNWIHLAGYELTQVNALRKDCV